MERYDCLDCPGCYRNDSAAQEPCGNGYEVREIDGKRVFVCRPKPNPKGRMHPNTLYCLTRDKGKKIGNKWDWTGAVPKWCPRQNGTLTPAPARKEENDGN